jgi:hypothetical protein
MIKRFESFGGMDYILKTTKEVMYDLPDGYTSNVYVEGERLDVEIMSDTPFENKSEHISLLEGKVEQVTERLCNVIRLCEGDGLKPYVTVILYAKQYSFANNANMHLVDQKTVGFKSDEDVETKLERLLDDVEALISIRMAFSLPKRVSSFQELPNGPEATQTQRVLNILKTLYPIVDLNINIPFVSGSNSVKFIKLFSDNSTINLTYMSLGDVRQRIKNDLQELDVEDIDATDASINKAIKIYLSSFEK